MRRSELLKVRSSLHNMIYKTCSSTYTYLLMCICGCILNTNWCITSLMPSLGFSQVHKGNQLMEGECTSFYCFAHAHKNLRVQYKHNALLHPQQSQHNTFACSVPELDLWLCTYVCVPSIIALSCISHMFVGSTYVRRQSFHFFDSPLCFVVAVVVIFLAIFRRNIS